MNGKAHGFGIQIYKNGSQYEGFWKNDIRNGLGVETSAIEDGGVRCSCYMGEYKDDNKHNFGIYQFSDGS